MFILLIKFVLYQQQTSRAVIGLLLWRPIGNNVDIYEGGYSHEFQILRRKHSQKASQVGELSLGGATIMQIAPRVTQGRPSGIPVRLLIISPDVEY